MNNYYDITLVERYFDNELTEEEAREFQIKMAADASFKKLVDQEKALIQGIRLDGLMRDLQYLKSIERTMDAHTIAPFFRIKKIGYYAVAAAVLIFTTIGLFLYSQET